MKQETAVVLGSLMKKAAQLVDRKCKLVLVVGWYDYESGSGGEKTTELSRTDILEEVRQGFLVYKSLLHTNRETGAYRLPDTLQELYYYIAINHGAEEGNGVSVCTMQEYRQRKRDEEYQKAEREAAFIAGKYHVKAGTLAFVRAAQRHYRRIIERERHFRDDGESRMERWAEAMYAGNRDGFWSDNDYAGEKIGEAQDGHRLVMKWLHRKCPLLMAQIKERKLRKAKHGNVHR